jgi:hypothetical protein
MGLIMGGVYSLVRERQPSLGERAVQIRNLNCSFNVIESGLLLPVSLSLNLHNSVADSSRIHLRAVGFEHPSISTTSAEVNSPPA